MRSRVIAVAVLGLLTAMPVAVAGGAGGEVDLPRLPVAQAQQDGIENEIREAQAAAEEAAGIRDPASPVDPLDPAVPDAGSLFPTLALAGIAAVGAVGLAAATFFYGGARFVTPAEVLQNDVRQTIYSYLKDRVGANLKQVTDDLSLTTTNAIWHLRKLEEAGLIHSRRFNGYKVFYPAEGGIEARRLSLGKTALANENAQEVFEHVVSNPGTHQREIARALGVNHGTVRWHLKKLMSAELIVETRKGKASSYEPTPMGLAALREITGKPAVVPERAQSAVHFAA